MINQINEIAKKIADLNTIDFEAMSTKELATWFGINRFSDRKVAMRRCEAKRDELMVELKAELAEAEVALAKASETKPAKTKGRSAAEGIAASWQNPEVATKRMTRNAVEVDGVEFNSVRAAFYALGLPDNKHIAFRMALKAEKVKAFEHDGNRFVFKIV